MAKAEVMAGGGTRIAVSREERKPKKAKLSRMEITRAKNGGHVVRHNFANGPEMGSYMEPTEHVFGKGEGAKLLAHLKRHLGIKDAGPMAAGETPEGEAEGAGAGEPDDDDEE